MKKKYCPYLLIFLSLTFIVATVSCNMPRSSLATDSTSKTIWENDAEKTSSVKTQETLRTESTIDGNTEDPQDMALADITRLIPVFAIANNTADQFITFYSEADEEMLKGLNGAIGKEGQFHEIKYIAKQESSDLDTARVVSDNFDHMEGYLYNNLGNKLIANETYFLFNTEVLQKKYFLPSAGKEIIVMDEKDKIQIEEYKSRTVMQGWVISEYNDGIQIWIIVFEPQGSSLLMSIFLKTDDGIKSIDYPAESDGQSAWRVDDEGIIDPGLFSILFAAKTLDGLLVAVCWAGAEGENIFFLLEQEDTLEQFSSEIYRYWSPQ